MHWNYRAAGSPPPAPGRDHPLQIHLSPELLEAPTFYVDYEAGLDTNTGTTRSPFKTIAFAVEVSRQSLVKPCTVILLPGIHFLASTIELSAVDTGLTITSAPGASQGDVWVSGGVKLNSNWSKAPGNRHVYMTRVKSGFNVSGLNTLNDLRRLTLARYPNADPELCRDCWEPAEAVTNWPADVSCIGQARVIYKDLRNCGPDGKHLADGTPCKNDSAMWDTYNTYTNGHGGCCSVWEGDDSPYGRMGDYYCGNSSAGGWVGNNDPRGGDHSQGQNPILPSGMVYNATLSPGVAALSSAAGGRLTVWRHQVTISLFALCVLCFAAYILLPLSVYYLLLVHYFLSVHYLLLTSS